MFEDTGWHVRTQPERSSWEMKTGKGSWAGVGEALNATLTHLGCTW